MDKNEKLPVSAVVRYLKDAHGREVTRQTVTRWQSYGYVDPAGQRHYLRHSKIGFTRYSTPEEVDDFMAYYQH